MLIGGTFYFVYSSHYTYEQKAHNVGIVAWNKEQIILDKSPRKNIFFTVLF